MMDGRIETGRGVCALCEAGAGGNAASDGFVMGTGVHAGASVGFGAGKHPVVGMPGTIALRRRGALCAGVCALACALFVLMFSCLVLTPPEARAGERLMVLTGTTLIEDVVKDVGGARVETRTVIPGAACPGHYDMRASDIAAFARADIILLHDWQRGQSHIKAMLATDAGAAAKVRVPEAPGNWMLPQVQARGTAAVASLLAQADAAYAADYARRGGERVARIEAVGADLREAVKRAGVAGQPVIADAMQRPLLEWMGLRVVADYGRFEEMGAEALGRAMTAAREAGAVLAVDNLQSTGGAGAALAADLGVRHVVLTNFPGGFPDAPDWESSLRRNVDIVLTALRGHVAVAEAPGAGGVASSVPVAKVMLLAAMSAAAVRR